MCKSCQSALADTTATSVQVWLQMTAACHTPALVPSLVHILSIKILPTAGKANNLWRWSKKEKHRKNNQFLSFKLSHSNTLYMFCWSLRTRIIIIILSHHEPCLIIIAVIITNPQCNHHSHIHWGSHHLPHHLSHYLQQHSCRSS